MIGFRKCRINFKLCNFICSKLAFHQFTATLAANGATNGSLALTTTTCQIRIQYKLQYLSGSDLTSSLFTALQQEVAEETRIFREANDMKCNLHTGIPSSSGRYWNSSISVNWARRVTNV